MEKRTLIAIALSFFVLAFYPLFLDKFYPQCKTRTTSSSAVKTSSAPSKTEISAETVEAYGHTPLLHYDGAEDAPFQTAALDLVFNRKGASLRRVSFLKFLNDDDKPLTLFSLDEASRAPFLLRLSEDAVGAHSHTPLPQAKIETTDQRAAAYVIENGIAVTKDFSFDPSGYSAKLVVKLHNSSTVQKRFHYRLSLGPNIVGRHSIDGQYIEANFFTENGGKTNLRHLKENKAGRRVSSEGKLIWVATKDRHFSIIVRPEQAGFSGEVEGLGQHRFATALVSPEWTLEPGQAVTHAFLVYIGPNDIGHLLPLGLDALVNFGKFDAIGKVLVGGLELLNKIFRNYGLAIIALTLVINLLLFPLTRAGYMSMKRMQLVQPQMTKMKEQHKGNPQKLNKEMMELYRKHKINPFGGCLPLLLQMPVFIALYVALSKSVILINSRLLWIKDLSSPDSVPLPFELPFLGNDIHVLPLIMVAAMVIQQKFTQIKAEGMDPTMETQQKMMTTVMPVMFGFIFYPMPSGLVLYWLTNTIVMTLYQLHLKKMTL